MPDLVAAVAEPHRRRLLQLLGGGEQTVTALASQFTVSRSAISQHLGVLAEAGLVASRREGRFQYYRLNPGGMADLRAELDSFWTQQLDQLVRDALTVRTTPDQKEPSDVLPEVRARAAQRRRDLRPDHRA
jgi:DNA-binding transcriptional ArsR family regulator